MSIFRTHSLELSMLSAVISTVLFSWWTANWMITFVLLALGTAILLAVMSLAQGPFDLMTAMIGATAGGMVGSFVVMAITVTWIHPMHSHHGMMIMDDTMAQMVGATLSGWLQPVNKQ
ncbi:hypothetical protein [Sulfobacillus thermosulfidooxidans]|uniref:hypothetical protein n=1 Tax=Sulfobacillus thermosulfidooxidans TaxID=28034 RepID=UPI00030F98D1|nr:hypothetical protein [Sulfobacillus thermosulfidooxidans]